MMMGTRVAAPSGPSADAESLRCIRAAFERGEEEQICVASDLSPEGQWGRTWLVMTNRRVFVAPGPSRSTFESVAFDQIRDIVAVDAIGGGRLEILRSSGDAV